MGSDGTAVNTALAVERIFRYAAAMDKASFERFDIYPKKALLDALDRWRAQQPGIPSRAEAARTLLEEALTKAGAMKPPPARRPRKKP